MEVAGEVVAMFVGGGATLAGKIVFDWLKNRVNGNVHRIPCESLEELRREFTEAHLKLVQDIAIIKTDLKFVKRKLSINGNGDQ